MRALLLICALTAILAGPCLAQTPPARFLKVDISSRNGLGNLKAENGPTEVHLRMPMSLAKGILDLAAEGHVKLNGKGHARIDADQLAQLVAAARPGDLLVEITTNTGDLVKIAVE